MTYSHAGLFLWIVVLGAGLFLRSRRVAWAAWAGLFLWAWPPAAALFSATLESRVPAEQLPADAEAIVVLSAGSYAPDESEPEALPNQATYLRCHYATWLYRTWKPVPVLATGGPDGSGKTTVVLADVMARAIEEGGVPRTSIWTERESRSTFENAVFSARLLSGKGIRRIVLVTEAYHMPRSAACFRKAGLEVTPAPVARRSSRFHWSAREFFPSAAKIAENEEALHEWVGLASYRLTGKI